MDNLRTCLPDLWYSIRRSKAVILSPTLSRWIIVSIRRKKNALLALCIVFMFYLLVDTGDSLHKEQRTVAKLRQAVADKYQEDSDWHVFDKVHSGNMSDLESQFYYSDGRRRGKPKPKGQAQPPVTSTKDSRILSQNNRNIPEVKELRPGYSWCDMEQLNVNDTDPSRSLHTCKLPMVSNSPGIDHKINTLDKIELPLLRNYRNPCWYEALPAVTEYNSKIHMFWWQVKDSFDRISKKMDSRRKVGHLWRLRCLPLVYVIGLTHSGSLDLYRTLLGHPFIIKPATKEPFYWDRNRWKIPSNISNYLDLFDEAAESIRTFSFTRQMWKKHVAFHPKITMDGSVNYLFEFGGLKAIPGNAEHKNPTRLIPHLIRNLTPSVNLKVFLTVRNPSERAFACYSSYEDVKQSKKSAEEFHNIVSTQISYLTDCFNKYPMRSCLHDNNVCRSDKKVELHVGVYVGYVQEWLDVFPDMVVQRWEDIKYNRSAVYKKAVEHIGLYPDPKTIPSDKALETDVDPGFFMWKRTKAMLDEFYSPFNKKLAELLKDNKFEFV